MNTRALYWAARAIVLTIVSVTATAVAAFRETGDGWMSSLITFGLAAAGWFLICNALDSLDKLKAEANRDSRMGLNGPARPEDLL